MSDDEASSEEDEDEDRDDSRREDDLEEDDESDEEATAATTTARARKPLLRIPLSRTQPAAPVSQLLNQVNTSDEKKTRQCALF